MKYIIILTLLISCGKQTHQIEVEEISGGTEHVFSPDFKAFREYCEGKIAFQDITENYTNDEYIYAVDECYYDLDIALPEIPAIPEN